MIDYVLDLIDHVLEDCSVSGDAMRWAPATPTAPTAPGTAATTYPRHRARRDAPMTDQTAADLSTLLDVPGMARAKRENEQLRNALARVSAALALVTAELAEARRRTAEEFAAACAAEYDQLARTAIRCHQTGDHAEARIVAARQRTWRAASDLAMQIAEE